MASSVSYPYQALCWGCHCPRATAEVQGGQVGLWAADSGLSPLVAVTMAGEGRSGIRGGPESSITTTAELGQEGWGG